MSKKKNFYCNPLNLPYKFQNIKGLEEMYREAADPSVVYFKGKYWLFPSMSAGFWYSDDLIDWKYKKMPIQPATDYAPDVRVIDDEIYFCASKRMMKCPIYKTSDPLSGKWVEVSRPFAFWDPNLFQDDDGRVYLYWGCTNRTPLYGVEMDKEKMIPIGEKVGLIFGNAEEHGWERTGENNEKEEPKTLGGKIIDRMIGSDPFIEGAWMTKHEGRYYLQYATPGTEYNIYADGVYVSESPLGPFAYAAHNPFSLKPGGFITAAGHGSTFSDIYGNLWHISTMRISVNDKFERRIGLFPAGFDKEGILFCNTNFADYPTCIPEGKWDPWKDYSAGWMLLSYRKKVSTSSTLKGYSPQNAVDEDIRTMWVAEKTDSDEWIQVDLGELCDVNAVQLNFAEKNCYPDKNIKYKYTGDFFNHKRSIQDKKEKHQYLLEGSNDGEHWISLVDKKENQEDVPHDFIVFDKEHKVQYLRLTSYYMPYNGNFAISGFRVFGKGNGDLPEAINDFKSTKIDDITANISWNAKGAFGYNVRWGIAPDKLYSSWMVYDQTFLKLTSLNSGTDYWVAIDAFNENGVSEGKVKKI